ncbi:MAG: acetyl-CoA C-acyltransferase [Candidatus Eremiobacteraeota bacterium]|nr:acetyl-CoA C-acyltransferase [Candidatus Eremiobacteraeota bacterium]MCW5870410.1 acetyl-CoA C-acyltransferase [Candidatus Eremiobacteraeota bacterium]
MGGARTPFGKYGGGLKDLTATDLAVLAGTEALRRADVKAEEIDHVVFGNVLQSAPDAAYLSRHVGLRCGVPIPVPAYGVNRLCGSGFQAVVNGAMEILLGQADEVLVGGTESMSQAPHAIYGARWGIPLGQSRLEDTLWAALTDTYCGCPMAITAENLAEKYQVTREEADEFAVESHLRAAAAAERLAEEIVAVEIPTKKGPKRIEKDEQTRADSTVEALARLKPSFLPTGIITAGNASGINDGAAALVLTTRESALKRSIKPLGKLVAWAAKGVQPEIMGIGPASAAREALQKAGLTLADMDLIEVNEAFAAQYVAVEKELGLSRAKTNVNGGAVALGHPLGASGARLTLTILHELKRRGGRYGLASACIGGGQGIALIVEAWNE